MHRRERPPNVQERAAPKAGKAAAEGTTAQKRAQKRAGRSVRSRRVREELTALLDLDGEVAAPRRHELRLVARLAGGAEAGRLEGDARLQLRNHRVEAARLLRGRLGLGLGLGRLVRLGRGARQHRRGRRRRRRRGRRQVLGLDLLLELLEDDCQELLRLLAVDLLARDDVLDALARDGGLGDGVDGRLGLVEERLDAGVHVLGAFERLSDGERDAGVDVHEREERVGRGVADRRDLALEEIDEERL
mmetsp:Transcript_41192/g.130178  ORF Transcript_41192/g.130178 Transcript_41192/m.130178 type:complete len:247 (-) Transcript_41192:28-768(-)